MPRRLKSTDLNRLENHVSERRFVEDSEGLIVNHRERAIGATFLIEEYFIRPGFAIIFAHSDRHVLPMGFALGIGEKQ